LLQSWARRRGRKVEMRRKEMVFIKRYFLIWIIKLGGGEGNL